MHGRLKDAVPRYEFAIKNIKYNEDDRGNAFYYLGCIYHFGTEDIPIDNEKTKQLWLRDRDEFDNESCENMLRIAFHI